MVGNLVVGIWLMKLVAFSDWRVQPFEPLLEMLKTAKPDFIIYGGDDTTRMADFHIETLKGMISNDGVTSIPQGFSHIEDLMIGFGTLKQVQKNVMKELERFQNSPSLEGFLRRHARDEYDETDPIWFGPPPRKKGFCLYYHRLSPSWIDDIAETAEHGLGAVIGNDCVISDKLRLKRPKVTDLHTQPKLIDGIAFLGLEGSSGEIGLTLYSEEEAHEHLENQWTWVQEQEPSSIVLVSHAPPKGVLDLSRRFGINNIGSQAVRDFIDNHDIDLLICGHSHINGGRVEKVGNCTVLNIASHDYVRAPGLIATITLQDGESPTIEIDRLFSFTSVLYNIHGVGDKRTDALINMGITKLDDMSEENRKKMLTLYGVNNKVVTRWILEAEALRTGVAYRINDPLWKKLNPKQSLIYDIETDSPQVHIWCIGVWNGKDEEFVQFFQKKDEPQLLKDFFKYVDQHSDLLPIAFSATDFDLRTITQVASRCKLKVPSRLKRGVDLGWLSVYRTIGTPKGGLKELGPFFGYEWKDPSVSGMTVGMEYSNYLYNGVELDWGKYLEYNRDDVMATLHVLKSELELQSITLE